jgi:hypothetical protein
MRSVSSQTCFPELLAFIYGDMAIYYGDMAIWRYIHPALINAVAALWMSAAEAEATTFDVAQVFELTVHSL